MKLTSLSLDEALARARTMPYAYIRTLSHVTIGTVPQTLEPEQFTEARFFGEDGEIRFCRADGALTAVALEDEADDITMDQRAQVTAPRRSGLWLTKRRYVQPDEDGQMCIVATRLLKLEGVSEHG